MPQNDLILGGIPTAPRSGAYEAVTSPYDGREIAQVAVAGTEDVERALAAAAHAAPRWGATPAHRRFEILMRAADLLDERAEQIAQLISAENGKPLADARTEAGRSGAIARLAAFEGTQLYGDSLPLDANPGTGLDKLGFTIRQPVGVVVAITPFNFPALLVMHKLAPALSAGNAVILKPARATPLTALAIARAYLDAGLPEGVLSVITGPGGSLGDQLVADPRVRKVSFTGSTQVGTRISNIAGVKRLSLELGASSPTLVLAGADVEQAAQAVSIGGYANAGQVCISVQRVIVDASVEADFLDALAARVAGIRMGDPAASGTTLGPLIAEREARRVERSILQAVNEGATLVTGGERDGAFVTPTILAGVRTEQPIAQQEIFGPAVAVTRVDGLDEAISAANGTPYGLAAGVFIGDLGQGVRAVREIQAGSVHLNWTPLWRADLMPYGGLKASGIGKEGVRSAVQEMTEVKTVILHG